MIQFGLIVGEGKSVGSVVVGKQPDECATERQEMPVSLPSCNRILHLNKIQALDEFKSVACSRQVALPQVILHQLLRTQEHS